MFAPRSIHFEGSLLVEAPVGTAFPLFSPLGEKNWVPEWNPELIHPMGAIWERGQIFLTKEERGEAVWVVTALDREHHRAEYYRLEPDRYTARVRVRCREEGERTRVEVAYTFVGLSETGNEDIAAMSQAAFEEKMLRWQGWIAEHFAKTGAR